MNTVHRNSIKTDLAFGTEQEITAAQVFVERQYPNGIIAKFPGYSDIDFIVIADGKIKCCLEIKARRINSTEYNSTIFPLRKHIIAKTIKETLRIPVFGIIVFQDVYASVDLTNEPDEISYVHRVDRNKGSDHCFYNHNRLTFYQREVTI